MIRPGIRRLFRLPLRGGNVVEQELDEEIRLHLELRVDQLEKLGMAPEEARVEALRRFGSIPEARRTLRRAARRKDDRLRIREWTGSLRQDLRYGARLLGRAPGFTLVVVATLALGIGTSVSVYGAARAVVTDAIPFPGPERLLSADMPGSDGFGRIPSYEDFRVWKSEAESVVDLAGYSFGSGMVGNGERTLSAWSLRVTGDFFPVLGPRPLLGRTLLPADARADAEPVATVSRRIWRELLEGDPDAVGSRIFVGERPYTLVGVLAEGQAFPAPVDVWIPLTPDGEALESLHVSVIGRLRPGATPGQVQTALRTIQEGLDAGRSEEERATPVEVLPVTGRTAGSAEAAMLLLVVAAGFLLLIGIANAAGLMTSRAIERRHEIAVRSSLGAGRLRIVRQLLVESTLLALAAGVCGVAVAHLMLQGLRGGMPEELTEQILGWDRLGLDPQALLFAAGISVAAGLVFGLAPAIGAVRGNPSAPLRGARVATGDRGGSRLARLLLAGEVALALALLLCAGLLTRSLLELMGAEPGFDPEGVVAFEWILPEERYAGQASAERFQAPLLERLRSAPGVRSVGLVSHLPAGHPGFGPRREYQVEGTEPVTEAPRAAWRPVTPEYLATLGIPLVRGRPFTAADGAAAPRVGIVSESLALRHWPVGADPIGQRLRVGDEAWTVVGVAGDVHHFGVGSAPAPTLYVPQAQSPTRSGFLVARVDDPVRVGALLRGEVWSIDPHVAVGEVRTMERVIRDFLADQRVLAYLLAVYASMALLITVISLYALVSHSVAHRRREFGIRVALGAQPHRILTSAMVRGLAWVGAGIACGILLAAAGARLLGGLLYGVGPLDPLVYVLVSGGMVGVAALASFLPARHAARADPAIALRAE